VAQQYIDQHRRDWRDGGKGWEAMLTLHVFPVIGDRPIDSIDKQAVCSVLDRDNFWTAKTKTAATTLGKIHAVLALAISREYRPPGPNPARWEAMKDIYASPSKIKRVHRTALPYKEVPTLWTKLGELEGTTIAMIKFAILTAARINEVRLMKWTDVDDESGIWEIPGTTMKDGDDFRRPLSTAAIEMMNGLYRTSDLVFPAASGKPMRRSTPLERIQLITGTKITMHGFRSTFRDWAAERSDERSEIAEMALAHEVSSEVERSYRRTELIDMRRRQANAWAEFCQRGEPTGDVVPFRSRA
jgi:integrase